MYLARTTIPKKRQTHKGLIKVYGLGAKTSEKICDSLGLLKEVRVRQLRRTHRRLLKAGFSEFFRPIGADLKNLEKTRCQRLINIQSYRGRRHKFGYPVRGQRTHTNARTQKKLHRRWFIKQHEKPKPKAFQKKNTVLKSKKPKAVSKAKPQEKNKKAVPKVGKYKIS